MKISQNYLHCSYVFFVFFRAVFILPDPTLEDRFTNGYTNFSHDMRSFWFTEPFRFVTFDFFDSQEDC